MPVGSLIIRLDPATDGDQGGEAMSTRLRPLLLDVPLALVIGLFSLGTAAMNAGITPDRRGNFNGPPWLQPGTRIERQAPPAMPHLPHLDQSYIGPVVLFVLIVMLGVATRRIRPLTGYCLTVVGATGYLSVGGPFGPVLVAPALGLLALATRMPVRRWAPWGLLLLPLIWAGYLHSPYVGLADPNFYTAIILAPALIMVPALIASIRRIRIEESRRSHDLELRRAAYQERLKIARDVHDLIGHSLSVINMQAGVALYLLGKDKVPSKADEPDHRVEDSLQAIRSTSKNALDELRATLAVFRGEAAEQDRAPVAGLARLPELVDSFRSAGRTVTINSRGRLDDLPGPVDNAAYRVVQEALTNVARHADGAEASVVINRTAELLVIDVTDNGAPVQWSRREPSTRTKGSGLIGMSERARAVGGVVYAGPIPEGGFGVHAEFPLQITETRA
jgi:signal transduction histidine kinase